MLASTQNFESRSSDSNASKYFDTIDNIDRTFLASTWVLEQTIWVRDPDQRKEIVASPQPANAVLNKDRIQWDNNGVVTLNHPGLQQMQRWTFCDATVPTLHGKNYITCPQTVRVDSRLTLKNWKLIIRGPSHTFKRCGIRYGSKVITDQRCWMSSVNGGPRTPTKGFGLTVVSWNLAVAMPRAHWHS